ncbi:MFS general substrate transporter [Mycena filopes]|nr:MFS general substrate transporter [Mycena filopes]
MHSRPTHEDKSQEDEYGSGSHLSHDNRSLASVPDGGFTAWMTIAGAWLVLFATFGYLYSFGVYENFYALRYLTNHSPSSIAWIGSIQLMLPFALGIVSGKLFDNGHFHLLEISGSIIFTFSLFMLSLAKPFQYYQASYAQGLGMGIGLGLTFVPTVSITAHHFAKRRSLATGIVMSGSSVGGTIFPIFICSALLSTTGVYLPVIYMQLFSVQHSVGNNLAFYSLAIMNGTGGVGRIAATYLADLYGSPFELQAACTLVTAATIWAVLGVHNSATLVLVSVLYGIFSGAWLALSIACLASLARHPDEVGARTGIALALGSFGSLGSAPIQGALLTRSFYWIRPVAFSAVLLSNDHGRTVFQLMFLTLVHHGCIDGMLFVGDGVGSGAPLR